MPGRSLTDTWPAALPMLPRAILLDLDDTILDDSGGIVNCWREACVDFRSELGDLEPEVLYQAIEKTRTWYWSDPERHRAGRLDLVASAGQVVALSLDTLDASNPALAARIGARYRAQRDALIAPLPDAIDTVQWLRASGCRLALVTNGAAASQRDKISRFALADLVDTVLIEGELGFGKPDPRVYRRALQDLDVAPADAWMVGDNIEWDVAQPQRMGIRGIWIDVRGVGLAGTNGVRPDRIVRALSELRSDSGRSKRTGPTMATQR